MAVEAIVEYLREAGNGAARNIEDTGAWPFGFEKSLSEGANLLRTAVHVANVQVLETAVTTEAYSGMGTTIVAALVRERTLSVAHVGDSRCYLFADDRLRQLTADDSWMAAVLAEAPGVHPDALRHHPMRNALTNAVGSRKGPRVHVTDHLLRGGEIFAMTTDGVHGVLDDRGIGKLLADGSDPRAIASSLVRAALARGSRDNCTAVVALYSAD
jgi:protein phosphatase